MRTLAYVIAALGGIGCGVESVTPPPSPPPTVQTAHSGPLIGPAATVAIPPTPAHGIVLVAVTSTEAMMQSMSVGGQQLDSWLLASVPTCSLVSELWVPFPGPDLAVGATLLTLLTLHDDPFYVDVFAIEGVTRVDSSLEGPQALPASAGGLIWSSLTSCNSAELVPGGGFTSDAPTWQLSGPADAMTVVLD